MYCVFKVERKNRENISLGNTIFYNRFCIFEMSFQQSECFARGFHEMNLIARSFYRVRHNAGSIWDLRLNGRSI